MSPRGSPDSHSRRWSNRIAYLYGFWLSLDPIFPLLVPLQSDLQNGVFLMIGAGIVALHATLLRPTIHSAGYGLVFFGVFTANCTLTMLINSTSILSARELVVILPMIFVLGLALLVASEPSRGFLCSVFRSFAISGACAVFLYIWLYAGLPPNVDVRIEGDLNPNAFGMICAAIACTSLSLRLGVVQALVVSVAFLGLYLSQSRSNMLGVFMGLVTIGLSFVSLVQGRNLFKLMIIACGAILIFLMFFSQSFSGFIWNDLFHFDDPYRGIGSGATNRTAAWQKGIELWEGSPLLGYGYRANERLYQGFEVDESHNGYIAVLVDLGLVGLLVYLLFVGVALGGAFRAFTGSASKESVATVALLLAYLVMAMFERFALNSGNAVSILFLIACFRFVSYPMVVSAPPPLARRTGAG
jgi:O-antigen ligase